MNSTDNRKLYTYLSEIEATAYNGSLSVKLKNRSVDVEFTLDDAGYATLNTQQFRELCEADDVSLSQVERGELHIYLCSVAEESND